MGSFFVPACTTTNRFYAMAASIIAGVLLSAAQPVHAETIVLSCQRTDVAPGRRANELFYKIDLTAGTISEDFGSVGSRQTMPARITATSIDWQEGSTRSHHIDRQSGHRTSVFREAGTQITVEFDCRKTQGF